MTSALLSWSALDQRQQHPKRGSLPGHAFDRHAPTKGTDDSLDRSQSEAVPRFDACTSAGDEYRRCIEHGAVDQTCQGKSYWPEARSCEDALVTSVECGTIWSEGDSLEVPYADGVNP